MASEKSFGLISRLPIGSVGSITSPSLAKISLASGENWLILLSYMFICVKLFGLLSFSLSFYNGITLLWLLSYLQNLYLQFHLAQ